jgi:hypothetical protein
MKKLMFFFSKYTTQDEISCYFLKHGTTHTLIYVRALISYEHMHTHPAPLRTIF